MAETIFLRWFKLRRAAPGTIYPEEGIIAKSVFPLRRSEDASLPGSLTDNRGGVFRVAQIDHQALKAGGSLLIGDAFERGQQFPVVGSVIAACAGKACRAYAGSAV